MKTAAVEEKSVEERIKSIHAVQHKKIKILSIRVCIENPFFRCKTGCGACINYNIFPVKSQLRDKKMTFVTFENDVVHCKIVKG